MKKLILLSIILFTAGISLAQSPIGKGGSQLNAGVGLSSWGFPVYFGLDFGVHPDITAGGEASFRSYHDNWKGDRYNHSVIGLSANGNYHFNRVMNIPDEWDFYAGLNLGFYMWNSPTGYEGDHSSGLGLGGQIGGRYYLNNNIGLNLEFGGGNAFSGGKFGISVKL